MNEFVNVLCLKFSQPCNKVVTVSTPKLLQGCVKIVTTLFVLATYMGSFKVEFLHRISVVPS